MTHPFLHRVHPEDEQTETRRCRTWAACRHTRLVTCVKTGRRRTIGKTRKHQDRLSHVFSDIVLLHSHTSRLYVDMRTPSESLTGRCWPVKRALWGGGFPPGSSLPTSPLRSHRWELCEDIFRVPTALASSSVRREL